MRFDIVVLIVVCIDIFEICIDCVVKRVHCDEQIDINPFEL